MKWENIAEMPCSVARTLSVIGDRWTMLILRDAFSHPVRFEALREKFGVTRHLLASRLDRLVDQGIFDRQLYQERPKRYEYRLTPKGHSLLPVLLTMIAWGDQWMDGGAGPPVVVRHRECQHATHAVCVCASCGGVLTSDGIETMKGPGWPG